MNLYPQNGDTQQLGAIVEHFPGSVSRFIWPAIVAGFGILVIISNITDTSSATSNDATGVVLFWVAALIACGVWGYFLRNFSATMYQYGFSITKGNDVTTARWDEIANVEHIVRTTRLYFFIPLTRSHSFTILLFNGKKVRVSSAFQNGKKLGETIQQLWLQAKASAALAAKSLGTGENSR